MKTEQQLYLAWKTRLYGMSIGDLVHAVAKMLAGMGIDPVKRVAPDTNEAVDYSTQLAKVDNT